MANEAHKEPTMEEILASIRKIIADDGPAPPSTSRKPVPVPAPPAGTGFSFDNDGPDLGVFETDEPDFAEDEDEFAAGMHVSGPEFGFQPMQADEGPSDLSDEQDFIPDDEEAFVTEPALKTPARIADSPAPSPVQENLMAATQRYSAPLTTEQTADAAAGALGKLISRIDMSSESTIDGLVRELLKPMMKEWLDANLARIVEEKVEAEVQRIARMAR